MRSFTSFRMTKQGVVAVLVAVTAIAAALLFSNPSTSQPDSLSDILLLGEGFKKYTNEKYSFSLEYPTDYKIETFSEKDEAETIVFQGKKGEGFQIFITPFEETQKEGEPILTKERILQDIPGAILNDVQEAIIGTATGQNLQALLFWSEDPIIGRTREVWFVHNGFLYEITAYEKADNLLAGIMSTFAIIE